MHLFRRTKKRDPKAYDPHRPHPFIDASDAGTAAIAASTLGMRGGASGVANLAVTSRVVRTLGCGVPGCGKAAAEDIHAPGDE